MHQVQISIFNESMMNININFVIEPGWEVELQPWRRFNQEPLWQVLPAME